MAALQAGGWAFPQALKPPELQGLCVSLWLPASVLPLSSALQFLRQPPVPPHLCPLTSALSPELQGHLSDLSPEGPSLDTLRFLFVSFPLWLEVEARVPFLLSRRRPGELPHPSAWLGFYHPSGLCFRWDTNHYHKPRSAPPLLNFIPIGVVGVGRLFLCVFLRQDQSGLKMVILLPQPPRIFGSQMYTTTPDWEVSILSRIVTRESRS